MDWVHCLSVRAVEADVGGSNRCGTRGIRGGAERVGFYSFAESSSDGHFII